MKKNINWQFLIGGSIISLVLMSVLAKNLNYIYAPDEKMRYDIVKWMFEHNALPVGNEIELRDPFWGASYAFLNCFPQMISSIFMKVMNVFTNESSWMLFSARLVSVFSYVGLFVMSYLLGRELSCKKYVAELTAVSMVCVPQVVFLGSYINNDIVVLFECSIIVYTWVRGYKSGWSYGLCVTLGIAIGFTILTYYNACIYSLISMVVCFYCVICKEKLKIKQILLRAGVTILSAITVSGWFLIRHYIIYDGDFLGLNSYLKYRELYAIDYLKPSTIYNGVNSGKSFADYFFPNGIFASDSWFVVSYKSFVGTFGYMEYSVWNLVYIFFMTIWIAGIIGFLIKYIMEKRIRIFERIIVLLIFFLSFSLPWIISLYFSYTSDYQPQGRYGIISLIPLTISMVVGIGKLIDIVAHPLKINSDKSDWIYENTNLALAILIIVMMLATLFVFLIPRCFY